MHDVRLGQAPLPVAAVADERRLRLAGREMPELERPGAVGLGREVGAARTALDDVAGLRDQRAGEVGDRAVELEADGMVVHGLDPGRVEERQQRGSRRLRLRIDQPLERVDDVLGGQRAAVVEAHALAQLECPDLPDPLCCQDSASHGVARSPWS